MPSVAKLLGSGFGLGLLPFAPGTFGTLLGVLVAALLPAPLHPVAALVAAALAVALGRLAERLAGRRDPPWFVLDEVAGYLVATSALPGNHHRLVVLAAAFTLFRTFDILKPWPARSVERWHHGWGIVADDLVAGLYANTVLRLGLQLLP